MDEKELDATIDHELAKRERDPQLRMADALEEIVSQLQRLNDHLDTTVKLGLGGIASAAGLRRR